jgi:hypothetical protein
VTADDIDMLIDKYEERIEFLRKSIYHVRKSEEEGVAPTAMIIFTSSLRAFQEVVYDLREIKTVK